MLGSLINTVADVARAISDYLHFSVPDKGPLSEFESWMPDFMKGLADGINKSRKYELYVDAKDISEEEQVEGETVPIPEEKYIELLKTRGSEKLVDPKTASESEIAANSTQYVYNRDYYVGDYVTVEHKRFGMIQPKVQLIGMIEAFDQNGRSLTPTFKE